MEKGFEPNPYDRCVANKIVNSKQFTLVCYVDDKKLSRMEAKSVVDLISDLKSNFGGLVVTRANKHTFFGMNINITEEKKVEIDTKEQLLEAIEAFWENIDEKVTTPSSSHLFIFNEKQVKNMKKRVKSTIH